MKTKSDNNFTYSSYLQRLYANNMADKDGLKSTLLRFTKLAALSSMLPSAPVFFIIDYTKGGYLFFSNSLGNYCAQQILEGGLEFMIPLMPMDFFKTYNEKVFPTTLSFLKNIPVSQHTDYTVCFNHRIKNSNKTDMDIYQRCTYLSDKHTGLPTYCIGTVFDISQYKNDNIITLSIERTEKKTGLLCEISKNYFYPYEEDSILTKKEMIILKYSSDGLSAKMIAHKLNLSINTINNHRTNMYRKTNTKNIADLLMLAVRKKIL